MKKIFLTISVLLGIAATATSCLDMNSENIDQRISLFPNTKFPFNFSLGYTFDHEFDTDMVAEPVQLDYELDGDSRQLADYLGDTAAFMDVSLHALVSNGTGASFKLQLSVYGIGGIVGDDCSSNEIMVAAGAQNVPLDFTVSREHPFSSIDRIGLKLVPVSGKVRAGGKIECVCEYFTSTDGIIIGN